MSWRDQADALQEACLETFRESDGDDVSIVSYEPQGGVFRVLARALFFEPHVERTLEGQEAPVSSWETYLDAKIADLLPDWPLAAGSRFVLRRPRGGDPLDSSGEVVYEVWDHRLDGEGLVRLMLRPGKRPT